jgi:hypothetical protein
MAFEISDTVLSVTVPFAVYWLTACTYEALSASGWKWLEKYRIHTVEEDKQRNRVRL